MVFFNLFSQPRTTIVKDYFNNQITSLIQNISIENTHFLFKQDNVQLYLALVDLAYSSSHSRDSEIVAAFDTAIDSKDLGPEERFQFSMRKMEFLEELGNDVGR